MPEIHSLGASSSAQRGGLNHQAIEDYLKTIYKLALEEAPVSTSRIAEARSVKPASATGMIKRLANLDLVHYEKHRGVSLTDEGTRLALEVIRHHRLIEAYLIEALGFTWDEVHDEADVLEHVISEKLEERIAAALGYPEFDPHGAPIPTKEGEIAELAHAALTELPPGTSARVARIADDDNADLLRDLAGLGLQPGAMVRLIAAESHDGPLTLIVNGVTRLVAHNLATAVLVDLG